MKLMAYVVGCLIIILLLIFVFVSFYPPLAGRIPRKEYKTAEFLNEARELYIRDKLLPIKDKWGNYFRMITDQNEIKQMEAPKIRIDHEGASFIIYSFGPNGKDEEGMGDDMLVSDIHELKFAEFNYTAPVYSYNH